MKQKVAAFVLLLVAMVGLGAAPAIAAEVDQDCVTSLSAANKVEKQVCKPATLTASQARWSYCNPATTNNRITFFDNQGYCGSAVQWGSTAFDECQHMGAWANWAGSAVNKTSWDVLVLAGIDCNNPPAGSGGWIPWLSSHPNFYNISGNNIGNQVDVFMSLED